MRKDINEDLVSLLKANIKNGLNFAMKMEMWNGITPVTARAFMDIINDTDREKNYRIQSGTIVQRISLQVYNSNINKERFFNLMFGERILDTLHRYMRSFDYIGLNFLINFFRIDLQEYMNDRVASTVLARDTWPKGKIIHNIGLESIAKLFAFVAVTKATPRNLEVIGELIYILVRNMDINFISTFMPDTKYIICESMFIEDLVFALYGLTMYMPKISEIILSIQSERISVHFFYKLLILKFDVDECTPYKWRDIFKKILVKKWVIEDQIDVLVWSICMLLPHTPKPVAAQVSDEWCIRCLRAYSGDSVRRSEITHMAYLVGKAKNDEAQAESNRLREVEQQKKAAVSKKQSGESTVTADNQKMGELTAEGERRGAPTKKRCRRIANKIEDVLPGPIKPRASTSSRANAAPVSGYSKPQYLDPKRMPARAGTQTRSCTAAPSVGRGYQGRATLTSSALAIHNSRSENQANLLNSSSRGFQRDRVLRHRAATTTSTSASLYRTPGILITEDVRQAEIKACAERCHQKTKRDQATAQASNVAGVLNQTTSSNSSQDEFVDIM